jgi:hypothetical protein
MRSSVDWNVIMWCIPVFGEWHKDSVWNFHSLPECCPENAHQFISSLVHIISDFIVKLKGLCFLPMAPQLLEMFLLAKSHAHVCSQNYTGIAVTSYAALPSIVCDRGLHLWSRKHPKSIWIRKIFYFITVIAHLTSSSLECSHAYCDYLLLFLDSVGDISEESRIASHEWCHQIQQQQATS